MEIRFMGHGPGFEESVGSVLIRSFLDTDFNKFNCFVGFASLPAINGLKESIQKSKTHIREFNVFVGIDLRGTSKEALEALMDLGINAHIYYTFSPVIFHPKVYLFEGDKKCRIVIGSSNLTIPGLFQNIEASFVIDFVKPDKEGEIVLSQIYNYFKPFFNRELKNVCKLTPDLIQELFRGGIIPTEKERKELQENKIISKKVIKRKKDVVRRLKQRFLPVEVQKPPASFRVEIKKGRIEDPWELKGRLVWKKSRLYRSDVQRPTPRSAATGGIRLTRSEWEVGGRPIDQTTYFRQDLFGGFKWGTQRGTEVTVVSFRVKILGADKGLHRLVIRHKPSWEAEQGNYTTLISWGELGKIIEKANLIGREFLLYAPPNGKAEPFYIEII